MKTLPKLAHWCVLILFLLAVLGAGFSPGLAARPTALVAAAPVPDRAGLAALPGAFQGAVSAALGADDPAYAVTAAGTQYQAANPRQGLSASLGLGGFVVRSAAADWGLRLAAWGRGERQQELAAGISSAWNNRVEVARGSIVEWWVNGPLGLEQGWTVAQPPHGAGEGLLTLILAQSGSLRARDGVDGQTLAIVDRAGREVLRYSGLAAADAHGRALLANFELAGDALRVVVDDAQAVYPLRIDPWVQTAVLTAADGAASDLLGRTVAISADGSTVVAGAPPKTINAKAAQGAVYVFIKPAAGWVNGTSTARLLASDGEASNYFGGSLAISGNGATIVVGSSEKTISGHVNQGQVYVFARPPAGWSGNLTETARLTASDGAANDGLGRSVTVNSDGTTVVAGSSSKNSSRGQVYVFLKPTSGGWAGGATEIARLTASDGVAGDRLGCSVAVSGDGATIAAGAMFKNVMQGAVYVFVKPTSGGWVTGAQKAQLTTSDGQESDFMGSSVAISSDGATIAAGAPNKFFGSSYFQGEAYVFIKPASGGWVNGTEKAQLKSSTGAANDSLGTSVAISADGTIVAAGATYTAGSNTTLPGTVFVYVKPVSAWVNATETSRLTPAGVASAIKMGTSVAVGGSIIVSGGPYRQVGSNTNQGAVYVFKSNIIKKYLPVVVR